MIRTCAHKYPCTYVFVCIKKTSMHLPLFKCLDMYLYSFIYLYIYIYICTYITYIHMHCIRICLFMMSSDRRKIQSTNTCRIPWSQRVTISSRGVAAKALIFQKTKMMWDVQRIHGSSGKNASIIKAWFRKHVAREAGRLLTMSKLHGLNWTDISILFSDISVLTGYKC